MNRYYSVRRLIKSAREPGSDVTEFNYSKADDAERRKHLELLLQRPIETIMEERSLTRKLEKIYKMKGKLELNRQRILRLLIGDFFAATEGISSTIVYKTLKKKRRSTLKGDHSDTESKQLSRATYLLSQKTGFSRVNANKNLEKLLSDFEIAANPSMICDEVCQRFRELKESVKKLLELKKKHEKLKVEARALKLKRIQEDIMTPDRAPSISPATQPQPKRKADEDVSPVQKKKVYTPLPRK